MPRTLYDEVVAASDEMELRPGGVVLVALKLLCWVRSELRWGSRLLIRRAGVETEWDVSALRTVTPQRPVRPGSWPWLRGLAVMADASKSE
jgi:hypothetical protein